MKPGEVAFYAYTDPAKYVDDFGPTAKLEGIKNCESFKDVSTDLFNAGFTRGFLDGKAITLAKTDANYYQANPNEVAYAQYVLTGDKRYIIEFIEKYKKKLFTLGKVDGTHILFPTVDIGEEKDAILTYTNRKRIPKRLREKYKDYTIVRLSVEHPYIVNNDIVRVPEEDTDADNNNVDIG